MENHLMQDSSEMISENWIHPNIPERINFKEQINLKKGSAWTSPENENQTKRSTNGRPLLNSPKVVHSSGTIPKQISNNPLVAPQQFSNHKMDIYQKIQKRFYGKKKSDSRKKDKSKEDDNVPECAKKDIVKHPKKECPPIIKSEGQCCRVTMPGCKKSCKFHRKYCCVKTSRKKCHRKRTPKPSFSECHDLDMKTHPECDCGAKQSPCEHDKRKRRKPKQTKTCE